MQPKVHHFPSNGAFSSEKSSIANLQQGACLLSAGVLAGVEGPGSEVDEFRQLNASPKSKPYPSTTASTPPLRRFRHRLNAPSAQRSCISQRRCGGSSPC